jgi:hypothetical protein
MFNKLSRNQHDQPALHFFSRRFTSLCFGAFLSKPSSKTPKQHFTHKITKESTKYCMSSAPCFFWFIVFWGRGVSQEGELKNTTQNVDQQKACRFVLPKQNVVFFPRFFYALFLYPNLFLNPGTFSASEVPTNHV